MSANDENELRKGDCLSHYEIEKLLGAGGMGEVYLARDTKLDRKVAIKILNQSLEANTSNIARFIQEAKAVSALNHPNILVIHEIGEHEARHFIVSEYIDGQTLRTALNANDRPIREILDISIQIASALNAAHEKNIVHRDIKPENVILRPDGLAKVLDFGLAKLVEQKTRSLVGFEDETARQNQTAKGLIVGTVNYLSPEQAKGDAVDERTDIFSLGVLLYEMIAGRTPFAGDSIADNFANLINKDPQPLSRFAANVPDELQRIVSKMLRKNRDERYQTMKGLLADLKELKEKITIEEKLGRSSSPETEQATAILHAATADANRQTVETETSLSGRSLLSGRKRILFAGFSALLLSAAAFAWYWRQPPVGSQSEIKSLAILPLKSLDAGENYLGLGIADAVIRRISQTGELTVRPTSAVRHYLNEETDALTAAKQLTADAVLEGNVQRANDRLRVSVNLLRTSDGASLWADSFDMLMTDIFTIQDTVAQQVATRLRLRLDPSEQARLIKRNTSNPNAYEFYVKGIYNLDQRGDDEAARPQMEQTIGFFKKAIEADPNYALAHAQLAYAYAWTTQFIDPTEPKWAELAKDEIKRSEDIDPQLAESHRAKAMLLASSYEGFQMEAAVRELLLAQQLNPSVGHAELAATYGHMGLEDPAARELQRALEIDPTSQANIKLTLTLLFLAGRPDEYLALYEKLEPGKPLPVWCLRRKGQLDDAQARIDDALKKYPDDLGTLLHKSLLLAVKGDFSSAEAAIPRIAAKLEPNTQRHHVTYDIACVYALTGNSGEAVKWLRDTAETGFPNYPLFERDPYLNRIRQAPEFVQLMAELKPRYERYRSEFGNGQ